MGRVVRRITPRVELALLGLIAVIVLLEFASWHEVASAGPLGFLRGLLPGNR
jgi:hypothetical protein